MPKPAKGTAGRHENEKSSLGQKLGEKNETKRTTFEHRQPP